MLEEYPRPSTCSRRLDWDEQGVRLNIWRAFLSELNERQQLKWSELFGGNQPDAMFLAQSLIEFAAIVT